MMKHAIPISLAAATVALAVAIPVYAGSGQSQHDGDRATSNQSAGDPGGSFTGHLTGPRGRGVPGPETGTGVPALIAAAGFIWLVRRRRHGS